MKPEKTDRKLTNLVKWFSLGSVVPATPRQMGDQSESLNKHTQRLSKFGTRVSHGADLHVIKLSASKQQPPCSMFQRYA